ncbi:MAG: aminotransferase class I/II-fold pyridoxal phosphate-dependent enzyme, partial [Sedimentisphaerales bacterium]|nr:aminotransferase class I/II-fold pyridoxal phosphate-dependent enzyme [Sedimentisphaerales bacterium]
KVKDSYNVDTVAIEAAAAAISDQDYFKTNVAKIKTERERLIRELRALKFDVPDSHSNFVLARCVYGEARQIHQNLAEKNIFVRYFDLPGLEDKLRISVGSPDQNTILLAALQDLTGR